MSTKMYSAALPETCFGVLDTTGALILIKAGEKGYYPTEGYRLGGEFKSFDEMATFLNKRMGITRQQRMAMEAGSIFGFDLPIAEPAAHDLSVFILDLDSVDKRLGDEARAMRSHGATTDEIKARFAAAVSTVEAERGEVILSGGDILHRETPPDASKLAVKASLSGLDIDESKLTTVFENGKLVSQHPGAGELYAGITQPADADTYRDYTIRYISDTYASGFFVTRPDGTFLRAGENHGAAATIDDAKRAIDQEIGA